MKSQHAPAPYHTHASFPKRRLKSALLLAGLSIGWPAIIPAVLASSANLTTTSVANLAPATVFAGAQNVAILSFTLQVNPAGVSETFRDALVQFTGDSTADIASVQLYRESGAVPGSFNPATDTLLASATTPLSGEYTLDPANFNLAVGSVAQFYVVANVSSSAVDGH